MDDDTTASAAPPAVNGLGDEELLRRVGANKDKAAFGELFGRYAGRVKGFLIRAGAHPDTAEEAAQEVMVTLWRRAELYDPSKGSAATWIFTLARNKRIDLVRRVLNAEKSAAIAEDPPFQPDPVPSAERVMADESRDARVRSALEALTEAQRDVIRLAFFSGLSHGEIAAELSLPLGTVKSRLRLAFEALRTRLGAEFSLELTDE